MRHFSVTMTTFSNNGYIYFNYIICANKQEQKEKLKHLQETLFVCNKN